MTNTITNQQYNSMFDETTAAAVNIAKSWSSKPTGVFQTDVVLKTCDGLLARLLQILDLEVEIPKPSEELT